MPNLRQGVVLRTDAKIVLVRVGPEIVQAAPRGILYGEDDDRRDQKNPIAVGDDVEVDLASSPASVERVLPRRNYLSRIASSHDPREQVLAANVDQLLVVGSLARPTFSSNRTDRILAACTWQHIPCGLILNKVDLARANDVAALRETYEAIPIEVIATSATTGQGVETVRERLAGKRTVLYGASGAGKSSLLNALEPGLKLKVGKISKFWDQGKHTTTHSQLLHLESGAEVVDTPGIRVFRPFGVPTSNLRDLFPDFGPYQARCKFSACSHDHEPECKVFEAVENGELASSRYASYLELLDEARGSRAKDEEESLDS